ncbi:type II toxin-antitoxin system VapC family toxin [Solirubrobacter sp. CPCC 204708]|uniref:Ribonuclease VapC n=1 Tax=Solirubrobacter deserti TaxID=2282478 RepID=A0ABT4RHA7_9ACTN|nr:type II toxin-antitoxin system VapC family toxin [Solirubrobacter deserti]MBE2315222.1 type II toxin-antitoxin system VapC family toxin [Solirubrobacter deserti]MDA0137906.1 type II toxin-antitoxin system VapC family toxin [Solirubrobacter deserti]
MIVLDASALADFLLGREAALATILGALEGREHEWLHAPELIEPETLSVLRRHALSGAISAERARAALDDLGDLRLMRHPHAPLRERVWALRHNLTSYDATYLALAEALPDPLLITGDRGLFDVARRSVECSLIDVM